MQADLTRRDWMALACAGGIAGGIPAGWAAGPVEPPAIRGRGLVLAGNWDFSKPGWTLDALHQAFHTRYIYAEGRLDHLNDEWTRYRDNDNHVFGPGHLSLVARAPRGLAPGEIESGMLRSRWVGRYGYFECRLRVPRGRGMWPAFWINPQDMRWPPEIDVMEIVNNGRDTTANSFHFLHGRGAGQEPPRLSLLDRFHSYRPPGTDFADDFHTFAVDWTPDTVRHWVDDRLVADRPYRWQHDDASDGGPAHLLLNLAVGGKWPGPPLRAEDFPARLDIAWLRVWQRALATEGA